MPPGVCWSASQGQRAAATSWHDDFHSAGPHVLRVSWTVHRPAAAGSSYLARFKGSSREHTESDLRCYLAWCAERGLDPLAARRPHLELYIRSMQEIRRFKPSTVSRRFSVTAGVLPDLRPGRHPGALTRRARPTTLGPGRIADPRVHPPAVRGPAHCRPPVTEPV